MQESRKVVNFGKIKTSLELPNLIEIQLKSYDWFLQPDAVKEETAGPAVGLRGDIPDREPSRGRRP